MVALEHPLSFCRVDTTESAGALNHLKPQKLDSGSSIRSSCSQLTRGGRSVTRPTQHLPRSQGDPPCELGPSRKDFLAPPCQGSLKAQNEVAVGAEGHRHSQSTAEEGEAHRRDGPVLGTRESPADLRLAPSSPLGDCRVRHPAIGPVGGARRQD